MVSSRDLKVTGMQEAGRCGIGEQWPRASRDQEVGQQISTVHKDLRKSPGFPTLPGVEDWGGVLTWLSSRGCSMALAEPPALKESLW